jgi:arylformamidase
VAGAGLLCQRGWVRRRIIDVSIPVHPGMLVYPEDPAVELEPAKRIDRGDPSNVSTLRLGTHTGTHVDPPAHFLPGGPTADVLPLDVLVGPAVVVDLRDAEGAIGPADLDRLALPDGVERLLLRTANSELWGRSAGAAFPDSWIGLAADGAGWIVEHGVRLAGIDFLSIEPPDTGVGVGFPTHRALLAAGVVVVEGLDLREAPAGRYEMLCLPLRLAGGDGAPARVVLVAESGDEGQTGEGLPG